MKNKKIIKSGLISFAICSIGLSFTSAATHFSLNLKGLEELTPKVITDKMMYVHFADNGNDFGGFLYFSNNLSNEDESESNYEIGTDAENNNAEYVCRKQVKGFYYNSERGERLWPLDDETRDLFYGGEGLDLTGGIYTNCAGAGYQEVLNKCDDEPDQYQLCIAEVNNNFKSDEYGYYGELAHTYSGQEMKLVMGVNYKTGTDFISIQPLSKLAPTFIRLQNKYPVGFVYDYNGGLGLAGCKFESESLTDDSMKKLVNEVTDIDGSVNLTKVFTTTESGTIEYTGTNDAKINCEPISEEDSLMRIIFEGVLGVSNSGTTGALDFGTMGNSSDKKMQYFATKTINNATMMNYAKKRAESLCRGKWKTTPPSNPAQITCLDLQKDQDNIIDATNYNGKTLIVKGGNVKVKSDIDKKYDIFIDGGNLLIEESKKEEKTISGHTVSGYDNLYFIENNGSYTSNSGPSFKSCAGKNIFTCINLITQNIAESQPGNYDFNNDAGTDIADIVRMINCISGKSNCKGNIAGVLKGNFIVNGKVKVYPEEQEKLGHKYFIYGKFVTKDSIIDLENMFGWRCINGYTSDGYICDKEGNPYRNASLIVIDQNYKSPVLGS